MKVVILAGSFGTRVSEDDEYEIDTSKLLDNQYVKFELSVIVRV